MPAESNVLAPRKPTARSRVSNGSDLLPNVDGRSATARRFRDICSAIIVDQGGLDRLSESRLQLIRRFAAAAVLAEQMESKLVEGTAIDLSEHAQLASTLCRLASRIGIDRISRDLTPTLAEYLAQKQAEMAEDTFEDESATIAPDDETPADSPPNVSEVSP